MYRGAKPRVKTAWEKTNSFHVRVGVHQSSDLSSNLSLMLMDDLKTGVGEGGGGVLLSGQPVKQV